MQLRQAAALHRARYRGGFHFAASLAAAQAGMKFAVAHNIPAFPNTNKKEPHFTASGKVSDRRMKVQGYINEAMLFVF
ncbi:MAG: hypothetical protein JWQ63_2866 [Mucilaginibacter sp.]|nr:hypothetical protein [Mucilaginibacter sp.]